MDTARPKHRTYRDTDQALAALLAHYSAWGESYALCHLSAAADAAEDLAGRLEINQPVPRWPAAARTPVELVAQAKIPGVVVALVCLADAIDACGGAKREALRVHHASALRAARLAAAVLRGIAERAGSR